MCEGVDVHEQRNSGQGTQGAVELATYVAGAPAFMAALGARLVVHNECLVAANESGNRYQLLVFPAAEVTWDGDTLTYQGAGYRDGDFIEVSGGEMDLARLHGLRVPEAWAPTENAFVVAPSQWPNPTDRHRDSERCSG
jgi:hypothetical protein